MRPGQIWRQKKHKKDICIFPIALEEEKEEEGEEEGELIDIQKEEE